MTDPHNPPRLDGEPLIFHGSKTSTQHLNRRQSQSFSQTSVLIETLTLEVPNAKQAALRKWLENPSFETFDMLDLPLLTRNPLKLGYDMRVEGVRQ